MYWVEALKAYAAKTGKYVVPKKGTPEYQAVRALMGASSAEAKADMAKGDVGMAEAHKAEGRALKMLEKDEGMTMKGEKKARKPRAPKKMVEPTAKPRKPRAKKAEMVNPVVKIDERKPKVSRKPAAKPERKARKSYSPGGATEKATAMSGNPEAIFESETNAHLPATSVGEIADLTGKRPRAVRKRPAVNRAVDAKEPRNAEPFSIMETKAKLGA